MGIMRLAIIGCSFAGGVYTDKTQKIQIAREMVIDESILDPFKGWPYNIHKKYNIETHMFTHVGDGLLATRFFIDEIIQHYGLDYFDKIIISTSISEPRVMLYKDYKFKISENKDNFYCYNINKNTGQDWLPDHINLWQLKRKFNITDTDTKHNILLGVCDYARSNYAKTQIIHTLNYIDSLGSKFLIFPYGWLKGELIAEEFLSLDLLKNYKNFKCYKNQSFTKFLVRNYPDEKLTVMDDFHHNERGQEILLNEYLKDILEEFMNA